MDHDDIDDTIDDRNESQIQRNALPVLTTRQMTEAYQLGEGKGLPDGYIRQRIERGYTLDRIRTDVLNTLAERASAVGISSRSGSGDGSFDDPAFLANAIGGALYSRMSGKPAEGPAAEWRGRSMIDMGAALLEARGERPNWKNRTQLATQMMARSVDHSTSDFPNLLLSAGNRTLLDGYKAAECPLKLLAANRDAPDFRALLSLKLSEAPQLLAVAEGAEIKHGTRFEAKESFRLKTFARMFSISRQALINDDLHAFAEASSAFGQAAARTEADEIVALFTANGGDGIKLDDGKNLYHADHTNKAASGAALSVDSLGAARLALRQMKGLDGKTPIGVAPKHLVVGPALETIAEQFLATLAPAQATNVNPFSGKLTLHVENRFAGNAWRLFADPSDLQTIVIAYLNGQGGPMMETKDGWDVMGTEFRCVLDFGCGITESRGTYLNPGA